LNKGLALSEEMSVTATEDIYDVNGMKLLAKGAPVSPRLQERLIVHRLKKPIESCIAVEDGIDGRTLAACAAQACEESAALSAIVAACGVTPAAIEGAFGRLAFGPAMTMMLTMFERNGQRALRHAAEVATLALAFAAHARMSPDALQAACMAGVLHDIGELYVDPALINASHVLTPEEWSHVIVHPHIGRLLIQDLETCPAAVGIAVSEHHERLNGTGYPRAMIAGQSSAIGQLLAGAELISGILHASNPLERIALALKIVNGEHPRMIASVVSRAIQGAGNRAIEVGAIDVSDDDIAALAARMATAAELATGLARGPLGPKHADVVMRARERLGIVQRAFMATGLDMRIAALEGAAPDHYELFESQLALREINWRLRDLGRDLAIQLGPAQTSVKGLERLIGLLCG
jgi:uncharacterized protein (UPF0212 family)